MGKGKGRGAKLAVSTAWGIYQAVSGPLGGPHHNLNDAAHGVNKNYSAYYRQGEGQRRGNQAREGGRRITRHERWLHDHN